MSPGHVRPVPEREAPAAGGGHFGLSVPAAVEVSTLCLYYTLVRCKAATDLPCLRYPSAEPRAQDGTHSQV